MSVDLAKPAIDVGVMTNDWPAFENRLGQLAVSYDHLLRVGGGIHQHRFACGDSVVKVNSHRNPLAAMPSTLGGLRIVGGVAEPTTWTTPDGDELTVVPSGHDDITTVEVTWTTHRFDAVRSLLTDGFGANATDLAGSIPGSDADLAVRLRIGDSFIVVRQCDEPIEVGAMDGTGVRYLTVQVRDVEHEHARLLALGAVEGRPPIRLGDTAYISFIRASDGTWIELSQRASLTGALPDDVPRA